MVDRCLLGVWAHPDDEAFGMAGVYAKYSAEGVRTALICATRGEAGEIADPALATPENLAEVRERELRDAATIAGIQDLTILGYPDGGLANADREEVVEKIVREIRRLRPQAIVTFDASGGYGHPDHMAIHRYTLDAFERAGDPTAFPEQMNEGLQPWAPSRLYVGAFPRNLMRRAVERARAEGQSFAPGGNAATISVEEMGTPDETITTIIPLSDEQYERKERALAAHATQMGPATTSGVLAPDLRREWLGTERFVRLVPEPRPGEREESLFGD